MRYRGSNTFSSHPQRMRYLKKLAIANDSKSIESVVITYGCNSGGNGNGDGDGDGNDGIWL